MMTTTQLLVLAALSRERLATILHRLSPETRRGRPWSCSLRRRVLLACAALRTNLTIRELAASFAVSRSAAHRIIATMTPRLAALLPYPSLRDRRDSWVVDGTLVPTRDHRRAARSKNYRWSCNAQILARRRDLRIVATCGSSPPRAAGLAIATIPSTIAAQPSRRFAAHMLASSPTAAIVASRSSSPPCFRATGSAAIAPGGAIVGAAHGSSTPSPT